MSYKFCILDYGSGNVKSVFNICSTLAETIISNEESEIMKASHIVLPGVGSFGNAMDKINHLIPVDLLLNQIMEKGKPFLGICVGMQVMLSKGYEFGEWKGLGLIPGRVALIETTLTLPHVGWNNLKIRSDNPLVNGLPEVPDFYFAHSYRAELENNNEILAETSYGGNIPAIITANGTNAFGVQFHPEKSQQTGIRIFKNFLSVAQ